MHNDYTLKKNIADKLPISSITPFTMQDFPDLLACILWFSKCNFRCKYCYNVDLVQNTLEPLPFAQIDQFLISQQNLLEGVVLSGGECTLFRYLPELIRYVKGLSYRVKVDTNGTNPHMLYTMIAENLTDYVALDYKAPAYKFAMITAYPTYDNFFTSLQLLCESNITLEIRTTVHTDLLNEEDINDIISNLDNNNFTGNYYVQNYTHQKTLGGLSPQKRVLEIEKLHAPQNFNLYFRNF